MATGVITVRDLHDMRQGISADVRHEVGRAEQAIYKRLDQLEAKHDLQIDRVSRAEARLESARVRQDDQAERVRALDRRAREHAAAITTLTAQTPGSRLVAMTPRQQAAFWTGAVALTAAVAEAFHRVVPLLVQLVGRAVTP